MLAYISILVAVAALNFAASLVAQLTRRAPGRRFRRAEALLTLSGGIYALLQIPMVRGMAPEIGGLQLFAFAVFIATYSLEVYILVSDGVPRWLRVSAVTLLVLSAINAIPGVSHREGWHSVPLVIADGAEVMGDLSVFGRVTLVLLFLVGLFGLARSLQHMRRILDGSTAYLVGGIVIALSGTWDALLLNGLVEGPKLTPFTMAVPAAATLYLTAFRTVEDALELDRLRRSLEDQVRARVEELSVAKEALLEAERLAAIGRIAGGLAHELNNPLGAALANVEHLRRIIQRDGPHEDLLPQIEVALADVQRALERGGHIVHQLLESAVTDAAGTGRPVSMDNVCLEVLDTLRALRPGTATIQPEIEPNLWVLGDSDRLARVLVPLVDNAIRAVEAVGGNVSADVHLRARPVLGGVEVEVEDRGRGMDATTLARVREPFFTTREPGEGRGLGVSVADGVLRSMKVPLQIESKIGNGTRVRFMLQRAEAPREESPATDSARVPRLRVLLVDDDPLVLRALRRMLAPYARVTLAEGVEAGLEAVESEDFNAIVCDLIMPNGGGQRFFGALDERTRERVVFMTGGAADPSVRQFLSQQNRPVLYKPANRSKILEALLSVAESGLNGDPEASPQSA